MKSDVLPYLSKALSKYVFPYGHPFSPDRRDEFWKEALKSGLNAQATRF